METSALLYLRIVRFAVLLVLREKTQVGLRALSYSALCRYTTNSLIMAAHMRKYMAAV